MDNVVIRLIVENNTKEAINGLDKLTDKEKEVKKNFDEISKSAKKAGDETKKASKEAENGIDKLNSSLSSIKSAIVAAFATEAIIEFAKQSVSAFAEAEQGAKKLEFAVRNLAGGNNAAFEQLTQQAENLASTSIFDDDQIKAAQTNLLQYGLSVNEVQKIMGKLVDVASITGNSIEQVASTVIGAMEGRVIPLQKEYGITVDGSASKTEIFNQTLQQMEKYAGGSASALKTTAGQIQATTNQIGELKESIGESITDIPKLFTTPIKAFDEWLEKTLNSEAYQQRKLKEQRDKNNADRLAREREFQAAYNQEQSRAYEDALIIYKKYTTEQLKAELTKYQEIEKASKGAAGEAGRIKALKELIELKNKDTQATKNQMGAYASLNKQISDLNTYLLDQLTLKKAINKEDVKNILALEKRREVINNELNILKGRQQLENEGGFTLAPRKDMSGDIGKMLDKQKALTEENKKLVATDRDLINIQEEINKKKQEQKQIVVELLNLTTTLANAYFEQQLQQIAIERDARLKMIEDEKNARIEQAGITNQKRLEYERQFELERQQVLKEAFEQEKKWKKQQAIINGALAITNILATTPDPTGIITGIRIGTAIATTAAQVAAIDAQKFEKGGWIGGKRHRDGGTLIEAEADEFVVNRKDAQANKGLLESLNKGMSEKYIYDKYVLPAILNKSLNQVNQQGLADNIANSLKYQMYDDHYLRKTFKQASMQSAEYIVSNLKYTQKPSRYV